MRQSEARDMRSFLAEPVEEVILEDTRAQMDTGMQYGVGARFIPPCDTEDTRTDHVISAQNDIWAQRGVGAQYGVEARFISPPEDARFMPPSADARFISPGDARFMPPSVDAQSGLNPLRPYHLQRYQSQGVYRSALTSGTLQTRSSGRQGGRQAQARTTADLAPMSQKLVPIEPSPARQSWEGRRRNMYMWLVLVTLFLLVTLGGIGLDTLIASYH